MGARAFKKATTTKSLGVRRYIFMFALTWITEKELERVTENKRDERGNSNRR